MSVTAQNIGQHCVRIGKSLYCEVSDHFIPHERNNYHPHVLKHRVLFGYSALLILLKVLVLVLPIALPSSSLYSSAITAQNVVDLTNQTRTNLGIAKLTTNPKLAEAAKEKAQDMLAQQYFSHISPLGVTPWDWLKKVGYDYLYSGENLAVHYTTAEDVQDGWLASPTHRANIVNAHYTEIGVGAAIGKFEGAEATVVVQFFGNPIATKNLATIANTPAAKGNVAGATATKTLPSALDEARTRVKPEKGAYVVRVTAPAAKKVTVALASQSAPLVNEPKSTTWQGSVPYDSNLSSHSGDTISVITENNDGSVTTQPIAVVAPKVTTQQLYTFNEGSDRYTKFFGGLFTVHNLQDSVRQFYFYFIVFLIAALLLNILIKIRMQHSSVITHAILVIVLTVVLAIV
ncbi:MAG: CAP domain-containing protein [bacterium]|nr:CAP domain-containing protein [bacterium]